LARRLVEHGVPIVSVNWHNDGKFFWDTHGNNFNRLKNDLIPPADQALAALLTDLDQSGMLDDTLVCWVGEFGRKPQITANNAGREHWPGCYCGLFAGAGIQGGTVFGASDNLGGRPADNPVSPQDYAATVYHALGIPPNTALMNRLDRPIELCDGRLISALWGRG
jgi:arylsulfatase A-like enzyme